MNNQIELFKISFMSVTKGITYHIFVCCLLIACNNKTPQSEKINTISVQRSDTATLLQLAIKTAFYHGNLPGVESLTENDSILVTSDPSYFKFIPQMLDTLNFKIVNQNDVCSLLNKDLSKQSDYLYIRTIERTDSNYYISIQNLNCKPYGGGGAIGIYFSKTTDSFIVKNHTSSSIN